MKLILLLSLKLLLILAGLLGTYLICFHYGWGLDVHSWSWVFACWFAALFFAGVFALPIWGTPILMAVKTAIYLATIFCLSCWAIIYGWGMHPRNWWLVIIPYAIAGCLPPFNHVSRHLLFWREDIDPVMQALVELHNTVEDYLGYCDPGCDGPDLDDVRAALENARLVAAKGEV